MWCQIIGYSGRRKSWTAVKKKEFVTENTGLISSMAIITTNGSRESAVRSFGSVSVSRIKEEKTKGIAHCNTNATV